jgi:hemerythrin
MLNLDQSNQAQADGTKAIPEEHIEIAAQIAVIRALVDKSPAESSALLAALAKLLNLTKEHFAHEEEIMIVSGFPGTLLHKRDHEYLVKGLRDYMAALADTTEPPAATFCDNLQSWLLFHIRKYDEAYMEFKERSAG